ncbi:hypothetical protein [Mycobacteroides chelonae]|jgi:hypothetical protein|uniref:hypothetical protein n=1 Tax=Mycobacteroides chelonae TaxID=1774 RepID=UPI0013F4D6E7|nr:hypothetical protein [Mycobacteroides chelonae]
MADYDRAEFTAWLLASCERQGVPVTITDPAAITQIVALMGNPSKRSPKPCRQLRATG